MRILLNVLGLYFLVTGIYILCWPLAFYDNTPGLAAMGPFNLHFIRDVSFAFLVSGAGILYGLKTRQRGAVLIAAAWPFLHALFHAYIWSHRGFPFDFIWFFDLAAVILPGLMALWLAVRMPKNI